MSSLKAAVAALFAGFAFFAIPAGMHAQVAGSALVGTVSDPAGGVIQAAKVVATNVDTNLNRVTVTNEFGIYDLSGLVPGRYTVTVEKQGFRRQALEGVVLQVAQKARLDVTMQVGQVSESVTVKAEAPLVDTETPEIGAVMTSEAVTQLPLNGRNFTQLASLTAGVNRSNDARPPNYNYNTAKQPSPTGAGAGSVGNSYTLDGTYNKDMWSGSYNVLPPIDSIAEFKVEAALYSAAAGFGGATVVNAITKSGTNEFRGTLWEFVRNQDFDATNFFSTVDASGRRQQPKLTRNQFGFTFGGPVLKDRTFFFASYEGTRERKGNTYTTRIPTAEERRGDLSNYAAVIGKNIVDPTTGQPFPNNTIPVSRINSISATLIDAYFPEPTNPADFFRNYVAAPSRSYDADNFSIRIDHRLSDAHSLFGRWSITKLDVFNPGANSSGLTRLGGQHSTNNWQNGALGLTSILTPSLTNDFRLNYNRSTDYLRGQNISDLLERTGLRYPLLRGDPATGVAMVSLSMSTTSMITSVLNLYRYDNANWNYPLRDDLTWVRGKHTLQMGAETQAVRAWGLSDTTAGSVSFTGRFTGDGYSDFLLGNPFSMSISFPQSHRGDLRSRFFGGYVQDSWKVTPKLTLNFGLRYELTSAPVEQSGHLVQWDPTLGNGVGGLRYPRQNRTAQEFYTNFRPDLPFGFVDSDTIYDADKNNWGPRFGLAYRPFGGTKTVIRTGYALQYWVNLGLPQAAGWAAVPPNKLSGSLTSSATTPTLTWESAYAGSFAGVTQQGVAFSVNAKQQRQNLNPYVSQWSVGIAHEILPNTVFKADYVGSKATKLWAAWDEQTPGPSSLPLADRIPFPKWGSITGYHNAGTANYNGLLLAVERRFSGGLSFKANWTWSHALSRGGGWLDQGLLSRVQNPHDLKNEVSRTGEDMRHVVSGYWVWDLPFGPGKRLFDIGGPLGHVIGGWQLTGLLYAHTGAPLLWSVAQSFCNSNMGGNFCLPNVTGTAGQYTIGGQGVDRPKYDRAYFPSPNFTYGNAGMNPLDMNSTWNIDAGLFKQFPLTERLRLEFRAEAFNIFNHPYLIDLNARPDSANFALATRAADPRDLQFALKLHF